MNPKDTTILELEILGYILSQPSLLPNVTSRVAPPDFSNPQLRKIFEAMRDVRSSGKTVEVNNLKQQLLSPEAKETGEYESLLEWIDEILREKDLDFSLFEEKVCTLAFPRWEAETVENMGRFVRSIANKRVPNQVKVNEWRARFNSRLDTAPVPKSKGNKAKMFLEELEQGKIETIKTGYPYLDKILGGLLPTQFVIIAGRPAMGKSTLLYNILENYLNDSLDAAILFSLEIGYQGIYKRLSTLRTGVDPSVIMNGPKDPELVKIKEATKFYSKLEDKGIFNIETDGAYNLNAIENEIRVVNQKRRVKIILIDYVQLIQGQGTSYERTTMISNRLKEIARKHNVVVIGLSQLSRGVEQRSDKRPLMSDLRDSGSLEQDADKIIMVYRDDYYKAPDQEKDNTIELNVVKNREGAQGRALMNIDLTTGKIKEA